MANNSIRKIELRAATAHDDKEQAEQGQYFHGFGSGSSLLGFRLMLGRSF